MPVLYASIIYQYYIPVLYHMPVLYANITTPIRKIYGKIIKKLRPGVKKLRSKADSVLS